MKYFKNENGITLVSLIVIILLLAILIVIAFSLYVTSDKIPAETNVVEEATDEENNSAARMANPIEEVASLEEMEEKLGFEVPVIKDNEVESYLVISDIEKNPYHGRIIYKNNVDFEIEKDEEKDVSGVYGAEKIKTEELIEGIEVTSWKYEDYLIYTWSNNGFSYSLRIPADSTIDISETLNSIE